MRVLTWNLWWRFGPWEARRKGILAVLREADPDILGMPTSPRLDPKNRPHGAR